MAAPCQVMQQLKYERQRIQAARQQPLKVLWQWQAAAPIFLPLSVKTTPTIVASISASSTSNRPIRPVGHHSWRRLLLLVNRWVKWVAKLWVVPIPVYSLMGKVEYLSMPKFLLHCRCHTSILLLHSGKLNLLRIRDIFLCSMQWLENGERYRDQQNYSPSRGSDCLCAQSPGIGALSRRTSSSKYGSIAYCAS